MPGLIQENDIVFPGDIINLDNSISEDTSVILGPGLKRLNLDIHNNSNNNNSQDITVIKCGVYHVTKQKNLQYLWIDSSQRRYVAELDERVVGVVTEKMGDTIKVDLGGK